MRRSLLGFGPRHRRFDPGGAPNSAIGPVGTLDFRVPDADGVIAKAAASCQWQSRELTAKARLRSSILPARTVSRLIFRQFLRPFVGLGLPIRLCCFRRWSDGIGLFDTIKGAVGTALGSASVAALPGLVNQYYPGGLNGVLQQLQTNGYGQQVASWLGHGLNDPIKAQDLEQALNNDHVQQIAEQMGLPYQQVLDGMAEALPEAVDKQSPNGQLDPNPT